MEINVPYLINPTTDWPEPKKILPTPGPNIWEIPTGSPVSGSGLNGLNRESGRGLPFVTLVQLLPQQNRPSGVLSEKKPTAVGRRYLANFA